MKQCMLSTDVFYSMLVYAVQKKKSHHPLMSPPEVWKALEWFSESSLIILYITFSHWLGQKEGCSPKLIKKLVVLLMKTEVMNGIS